MTVYTSTVHRFGPSLRAREAKRDERSEAPAAANVWPLPEPRRASPKWDEREWWSKQLGRPLNAA